MTINTNPLSYNAYIQQMGVMAVVNTSEVSGVWQFNDPAGQTITPQMLNYAELRIQRDLDLLAARTSNVYTLVAGNYVLQIPIDDFITVETVEILVMNGTQQVNSTPLVATSAEFIQNCYAGLACASQPKFFAMVGDNFGDGADLYNTLLLGPPPNYAYPVRVRGIIRTPSLFNYAANGIADTSYTYISTYYPDLLIMASMIYITMFQRNFGAVADTPESGMTYEKQYQMLKISARAEEDRRKQMGSAWSGYSTPVSATPTR